MLQKDQSRNQMPEQKPNPVAEENREKAARELGMISELHNNTAFQWFEAEFIDKPYSASLEALKSRRPDNDDGTWLAAQHQAYRVLRSVKASMIEREINWRKKVNPLDSEIPRLQEKLQAL